MVHTKAMVFCLLVALLCVQADPSDDDTPRKVKGDKDKLAKALEDDDAAWAEYLQQYGAGSVLNLVAGPKTMNLPEKARAEQFKKNFKAALREMDKLNKKAENDGDFDVAFSINGLAHLDQDDFASLRASGLLPDPVLRRRRRAPATPGGTAASASAAAAAAEPTPAAELSTSNRKLLQTGTTCASNSGQVSYTYGSTTAAASVDWKAAGFVTPVRDQGQCGSCVAFATTAITEFVLMKRSAAGTVNGYTTGYYNNGTTDLSETDMMGCEPTRDGCTGSSLSLYYSSVNCRGQGFEAQYPYAQIDPGTCPDDAIRNSTKAALSLKWAVVPKTNGDLMKAVTMAPTVIGLKADGKAFQYYSSGVVACNTENTVNTVNHAVAVVGYGVDASSGKKYFKIKNSWATSWGEQGYIRIQKDCVIKTRTYGPFAMFSSYSSFIVPVL